MGFKTKEQRNAESAEQKQASKITNAANEAKNNDLVFDGSVSGEDFKAFINGALPDIKQPSSSNSPTKPAVTKSEARLFTVKLSTDFIEMLSRYRDTQARRYETNQFIVEQGLKMYFKEQNFI